MGRTPEPVSKFGTLSIPGSKNVSPPKQTIDKTILEEKKLVVSSALPPL
jgi:hypothetical protein